MTSRWTVLSIIGGGLMIAGVMAAEAPWASPLSSLVPVPVANRAPQVDEEAPNFLLKDSEGFNVTLDQFRGKVVLLNFWATWCGPCRVEMPAMEQLYRTLPRGEFEILAVSTDAQGATVTRPFQKRMGFTFPILHDSEYRVGLAYGARTIPVTFMVDRQGVVRQKIFGARDWDSPEARDLIQALMKS